MDYSNGYDEDRDDRNRAGGMRVVVGVQIRRRNVGGRGGSVGGLVVIG